jgi:hypothetical protein
MSGSSSSGADEGEEKEAGQAVVEETGGQEERWRRLGSGE